MNAIARNANAIAALSYRDLLKFMRDRVRLISTLVFPLIFIAALGGSLQANLGATIGYNFVAFTLTGVFAQTLFQSSALGLISLIEDRENDFSQEIFVSPISRYSIIFGKILGESMVAFSQGIVIILFGFIMGVTFTWNQIAVLIPVAIVVCLLGGAFGVVILGNLTSQRAASQIFPFILLPQFFLAGVFNPIQQLPIYLDVFSRIAPLRYAVDFARGAFYAGLPEFDRVVLASVSFNLVVIAAMFVAFLTFGTWSFVRAERNR